MHKNKFTYYRWIITIMVLGYMFLFGPAILASQAYFS